MKMKLGLYSMTAEDKSPEQMVDLCCEVGIDGIEWVQWEEKGHLDPSDLVGSAEQLGEMTRKAGLDVIDFTGVPEADDPESVKTNFRIAAAMGGPVMRMRSRSVWRQQGKILKEQQNHVRRALESMAPMCEEWGVSVQYETVWDTVMSSASMARQLYEGLDPAKFGVLIDPANMIIQGYEGWPVCVEVLGPYLHNVHCKNVWFEPTTVGDNQQIRWRFVFRPIRLGLVDWAEVIAALKDSGYSGYICIEDCDVTYSSEHRIRDGARVIRSLIS